MIMIYLSKIDIKEDKNIFKILHNEYSTIMYKKAYGILKDEALAEDVVQESFIRIIKNFDKIIKKKCPQTRKYFVSIVRTISIDVYRKRKKQIASSFDENIDVKKRRNYYLGRQRFKEEIYDPYLYNYYLTRIVR